MSARIRLTQPVYGFLTRVVSLPSEKVPAPPSPKWTWLSGFRIPSLPEGTDIGETLRNGLAPLQEQDGHPLPARVRAAKSPAGPQPTTTGLRSGRGVIFREGPARPSSGMSGLLRHRDTHCDPPVRKRRSRPAGGRSPDRQNGAGGLRRASIDLRITRRSETASRGKTEEGSGPGREKLLPLAEGECQTVDLQIPFQFHH